MKRLINEETILKPYETQFRIEARIWDVEHALKPDFMNEYSLVFKPLFYEDYATLEEHLSNAVSEVELKKERLSNKEARPCCLNNKDLFFSSQLDPVKFNVDGDLREVKHAMRMSPHATITGYLKDLPLGEIVMVISYVDFAPMHEIDFDNMHEGVDPKLISWEDW